MQSFQCRKVSLTHKKKKLPVILCITNLWCQKKIHYIEGKILYLPGKIWYSYTRFYVGTPPPPQALPGPAPIPALPSRPALADPCPAPVTEFLPQYCFSQGHARFFLT